MRLVTEKIKKRRKNDRNQTKKFKRKKTLRNGNFLKSSGKIIKTYKIINNPKYYLLYPIFFILSSKKWKKVLVIFAICNTETRAFFCSFLMILVSSDRFLLFFCKKMEIKL